MGKQFQLVSDFEPRGDQPQAIEKLVRQIQAGNKYQTLLGATRIGKTLPVTDRTIAGSTSPRW